MSHHAKIVYIMGSQAYPQLDKDMIFIHPTLPQYWYRVLDVGPTSQQIYPAHNTRDAHNHCVISI